MKRILMLLPMIYLMSCVSDSGEKGDDFDRSEMLANWADHIIIPAYDHYQDDVAELKLAIDAFVLTPTVDGLVTVRLAWQEAYIGWQSVSMFEIGKAEELGLQGYTNTYPADIVLIESLIESGNYNLELPSRRSQQGFPALDYLINGMAGSDNETVAVFMDEKYRVFLSDIVGRIKNLTDQVYADWTNGYRDVFVNNSGSAATASVNKVTNDFIFYFEKHLRAEKIGIPAGVFGSVDASKVEAYYKNDISKKLFDVALESAQHFFNGQHFNGGQSGSGLSDYLTYLRGIQGGEDIAKEINDQFERIKARASALPDSFSDQVVSDNSLMLQTYDDLQENVILMKTDMIQKLSIRVDYVDADGD